LVSEAPKPFITQHRLASANRATVYVFSDDVNVFLAIK
jgi:hypothetical protein